MQKKPAINRQAIRFKQFSRKAYGVFNSLHKVVNTGVVSASVLLFANVESRSIRAVRKGILPFESQGVDLDVLQTFEEGLQLLTLAPVATTSVYVGPVQQTDLSDETAFMIHWWKFIQTKIPYFWSTDHSFFNTRQNNWHLFLPKSVNSGSFKFTTKDLLPLNGTYPIQHFFSRTKYKLCFSSLHSIQKLKDDIAALFACWYLVLRET